MAERELNELEKDSEISLLDIVKFLQGAWKKLASAAVVGVVLGFGNWHYLASVQAQALAVLSIN